MKALPPAKDSPMKVEGEGRGYMLRHTVQEYSIVFEHTSHRISGGSEAMKT